MKQQIITLHVKHQETRMERRERQRREMRGRFFAAVLAILAAGVLFWALAATEPVIVVETAAADKTGTPVSILETEEPEARTPARISRYDPITDEERDMIAGIVYLEAGEEIDPASYISGVTGPNGAALDPGTVSAQSGVDVNTPGCYEIHYQASDGAGNAGETWLTVIVEGGE